MHKRWVVRLYLKIFLAYLFHSIASLIRVEQIEGKVKNANNDIDTRIRYKLVESDPFKTELTVADPKIIKGTIDGKESKPTKI